MRSKSILSVAITVLLAGSVLAGTYSGGTGEPNNPFRIFNANDMNEIGTHPNNWDKHFVMVNDINLAEYTGTEFNIIGNDSNAFTGVFDGNEHTISNFTYVSTGKDYIGLFAFIDGKDAEVKNLGLINPDVDSSNGDYAGALVGIVNEGTISSCYVEGGTVRGILGWGIGGMIGCNHGYITNCYANVAVNGNSSVGGLVGDLQQGKISCCYATGSIQGYERSAGGIVGYTFNGVVSYSYATGPVSGKDAVGGLVGSGRYGRIVCSYAAGNVSATGLKSGGLLGAVFGGENNTVTSSFWDVNTTGQPNSYYGGTGLPTTKMQDVQTFIDAGWDFVEQSDGPSDIWAEPVGGGYPILWWQLSPWPALPSFSGGMGAANEPYLISTVSDLNSIGYNPRLMESHFKLMNDIDLADMNFFTIGNLQFKYSGIFDGNGHKILNLVCTTNDEDGVGLFGYVSGETAEIKDLGLVEPVVNVPDADLIAPMVCMLNGKMSDCYSVGGHITANEGVGGLVGLVGQTYGVVSNSYATGTVTGQYGGGLASNCGGIISDSYAMVSVLNVGEVGGGGFVASNYGNILRCSSTGDVTGTAILGGGFVGINQGIISNCYSTGNVEGNSYVGGFVGYNNFYGTIGCCYSTGSVTGDLLVGGFTGADDGSGSYTVCFWDSDVNPDVNGIGNTSDPNVIGKTTAEMQTKSTFTDAGWDFVEENLNGTDNIWRLCVDGTDYPKLAWEFLLGDFVCPDGVGMEDLAVLFEQWLLEELTADVWPDEGDGFVNFLDWAVFANGWQNTNDIDDLAAFVEQWLQLGAYCADISPDGGDGVVNMLDFAALAENWLVGVE